MTRLRTWSIVCPETFLGDSDYQLRDQLPELGIDLHLNIQGTFSEQSVDIQ
jgi:hypothetical protein